ncbi:MAG: PQQ-binding-like beta-propeller repeat protein, partial [Phycisphaerae bacterium]|nr:PQQ-binding-like beta-propeller repeat protein [Phycisphaerae bacterium]
GDMVPDVLAVSSSNSQGGGRKTVYLFDGTNGNFLWQHPITVPGLASGYSVISIEDVTGDNIPDAVAGYGGDGTTQFARGLDGSNGQTLWQFDGPVDGAKELLELPVAGQTPDVIVANFFDDIYRVNGEDGQQLWNFDVGGAIIQMNLIPDVNNNGIDDILVASFSGASQIYCLEGETGLPIWTSPTNDYRSYGVQAIPDINGDGIYEAIAGDQSGTVYVISGEGDSLLYTRTFGTRVTTVDGLKSIDGNDSHEVLVGLDDGQIFCLSGGEPLTGIRPNNDNRNLPGNFS